MNDEAKLIYEVNEENFQEMVLEKSRAVPVMVDFWAEWCAPCKMLEPVLEEIVRKKAGGIVLARLDVDRSPALAAQFGIRGIPAVKIFQGGEVVKEFVGARSLGEVEKIITELVPAEDASDIDEANRFLSGGRWEAAENIYQKVLGKDPGNSPAHLGLGTIAFHQARWDDAKQHLVKVESDTPGYDTVSGMLARIYFEKVEPPDLNETTRKLQVNPADLQALYSLSLIYARGGEYERALNTLIKVIELDRDFAEGEAKASYLKILDIIGRESELGKSYIRKLSMILFS